MEFLIIVLGLLPGFAWLIFFLKEDIHPEPKKMIAKVFFVGAVFTFIALGFEAIFQDLTRSLNIKDTNFFSFFGLSAIEEVFKFLAAYLVVRKSRFFDEPVDAMIYMIVAALGFATIENLAVMFNVVSGGGGFGVINIMILRFVGATLLHALAAGIVGFYWAHKKVLKGLVIATILHTIFNCLILIFSEIIIYPSVFLIIISFFVFYDFEKLKKIR
ncbi:MAG TPA: PrsW family intramembrane metalloprotease [Candidatus Wolfebacteria bacterium]|nr:PrsW family intramembrane metalloprotease [Candidatus Wolfebacteria bacterium]